MCKHPKLTPHTLITFFAFAFIFKIIHFATGGWGATLGGEEFTPTTEQKTSQFAWQATHKVYKPT